MHRAAARGASFSHFSPSTSSSSSTRVFQEISNVVRSKIHWRGKSVAASVISTSRKAKGQKRISKLERRDMVKSFVDKYRASNAGRFPTATQVQTEVGGCFYNIRSLVQELEYNHKHCLLNKTEGGQLGVESSTTKVESSMEVLDNTNKDETLLNDGEHIILSVVAKDEHLTYDVEQSTVEEPLNLVPRVVTSEQIVEGTGDQNPSGAQTDIAHGEDACKITAKESLQDDCQDATGGQESMASTSSSVSTQQADSSASESFESARDGSQSLLGDVGASIDISTTKQLKDSNGPKPMEQTEIYEASKSEELSGGKPGKPDNEESTPQAVSLWGNLKTFADGLFKFWKKM